MSDSTDDIDEIRERRRRKLMDRIESGAGGSNGAAAPDRPIVVGGTDHFRDLLATYPRVLVDFHAEWCGPCQMMAPTIDRLADEAPIAVAKVDIDRRRELAQRYAIRSVPTVMYFVDGEPANRLIGLQDESTLRDLIQ